MHHLSTKTKPNTLAKPSTESGKMNNNLIAIIGLTFAFVMIAIIVTFSLYVVNVCQTNPEEYTASTCSGAKPTNKLPW